MCNRRLIKLTVFYIISFTVMCYFIRELGIESYPYEKQIFALNGNLYGYSSIRNMSVIYVVFAISGFNYINKEKEFYIIKYKDKFDYMKRNLLVKIILCNLIFTSVYMAINIVYNLIYFKNDYLLENNFYTVNLLNSILFFLFYMIVLITYNIFMILFNRYSSMIMVVIINIILYFLNDDRKINILPQRYISKIPSFIENGNFIEMFITCMLGLSCYIIITYYIWQSMYKKKEYI